MRRLDVHVRPAQRLGLCRLVEIETEEQAFGDTQPHRQTLQPPQIRIVADLADQLIAQARKAADELRHRLDHVVLPLRVGEAADRGQAELSLSRQRLRAALQRTRQKRQRDQLDEAHRKAVAFDDLGDEVAVHDHPRHLAARQHPAPGQALGQAAQRAERVVQALMAVKEFELVLVGRHRVHRQRPAVRSQQRRQLEHAARAHADDMDEIGLEFRERRGDLAAERGADRNRDREVARQVHVGHGNVPGEGQLVAMSSQPADQLSRFSGHATGHEAGDVAQDEDPHQPRSTMP